MCPQASRLQAIFESELQPQLLQSRTFQSQILNFFQQRQHSQMNLRMLLILRPSNERSFMPIWTATFWRAKSALTNQILKPYFSCYSYLKFETTSAIFFSQFLLVIQPYSSSSSLEEDDTFLFGFTGTEIHSYSSGFSCSLVYVSSVGLITSCTASTFPSVWSISSSSSSQDSASMLFSLTYSSKSSFSTIGGGSFLNNSSNPSFLQSAYVTAMSSISTNDKDAISPVFLANSFTNNSTFSSGSTTSISKGKDSTNSLVLRSFNSSKTSAVVISLVLEARLLMLLIEMKAFASRTAIDFLGVCIVDVMDQLQNYQINQSYYSWSL